MKMLSGEPPFPEKLSDCTSRGLMINHPFTTYEMTTSGSSVTDWYIVRDESHGGAARLRGSQPGAPGAKWESIDNPLGYGDSSVRHVLKSEIRPRVQFPSFEDDYFHCW